MELINFRLSGRFAHFLRAEASASALSYPVPPRTVILGILGAVLGLSKDNHRLSWSQQILQSLGNCQKPTGIEQNSARIHQRHYLAL